MTQDWAGVTQHWAAQALAESQTSPVDPADTVHVSEPGDVRQWHALAAGARAAMPASPPHRGEPPYPASPWSLTVDQLLATYASHTLDPPSVVAALLARAGLDGPAPEAALRPIPGAAAPAGESALRLRSGTARPLEGVPFGVKDIIDVAGTSVTCGSHQTGARQAQADADCVAHLGAAGLKSSLSPRVISGSFLAPAARPSVSHTNRDRFSCHAFRRTALKSPSLGVRTV